MNIHHIVQYNKMIHKFTCSIYNDTFFFFMKKNYGILILAIYRMSILSVV